MFQAAVEELYQVFFGVFAISKMTVEESPAFRHPRCSTNPTALSWKEVLKPVGI